MLIEAPQYCSLFILLAMGIRKGMLCTSDLRYPPDPREIRTLLRVSIINLISCKIFPFACLFNMTYQDANAAAFSFCLSWVSGEAVWARTACCTRQNCPPPPPPPLSRETGLQGYCLVTIFDVPAVHATRTARTHACVTLSPKTLRNPEQF